MQRIHGRGGRVNRRRDVPDDNFPCGRRGRQPRDKGKTFIRQRAHGRFVFQENFRKAASSAACRKIVYRIIPTRLYPYPWGPAFGRGFRAFRLRFKLRRGKMPIHNTIRCHESPRPNPKNVIGNFDTLKTYNRRLRCAGVYPLPTAVVRSHELRFGSIFMSERRVARKAETRITDVGAWRYATVFRNCPGFSFGAKETGCGTELVLFPVAPEENRIAIYLGMFRAYDFVMFFLFIGG